MCLDIDPDSVIHKHINQKINNLYEDNGDGTDWNPLIGETYEDGEICEIHRSKHSLTMLPSFHISLGAPKKEINAESLTDKLCYQDMVPIVGDIVLADIFISEKNNKKSAWIPLDFHWIQEAVSQYPGDPTWKDLNIGNFDHISHHCDEFPIQVLHISLANLTGKPRDSIARPEDCIIDTITA